MIYKRILLWLLLAAVLPAAGQVTTKSDSVELGAGYQNYVYYSLANGVVKTVPAASWDIAFAAKGRLVGIMANSGNNVRVYQITNQDTSNWATLDTAGQLRPANIRYNDDSKWDNGAFVFHDYFEANGIPRPDGSIDIGWGNYGPPSIHHDFYGDSVFVIEWPGSGGAPSRFKKLWIISYKNETYKFRFASLDNSDDQTVEVKRSEAANANFIYYSLIDKKVVSVEPDAGTWDLFFGRYYALNYGIEGPQRVSGVLTNVGTRTALYAGADAATRTDTNGLLFSTKANIIGYDWKYVDYTNPAFPWVMRKDTVFFVATKNGAWKLQFTNFGGQANGRYIFNKTDLRTATGIFNTVRSAPFELALAPNPGQSMQDTRLIFTQPMQSDLDLQLTDLTGRVMYTDKLPANTTEYVLPPFGAGVYLLNLRNAENRMALRWIVH